MTDSKDKKKDAVVKTSGGNPNSMVSMNQGGSGIQINTLDDAMRLAKYVQESGLAPKGLEKPESIVIAMQCGFEIGLKPMQALQSIAVINGRPTVWGDAALGLVRASGELEVFEEWYEGEGDKYGAYCKVRRRGDTKDTVECFTIEDAKRAKLWGKDGPWKQYPKRMLRYRNRNFILRDKFTDILKGLKLAEDVMDEPIDVTSDVDAGPAKGKPQKTNTLDDPSPVLDKGKAAKKLTPKKAAPKAKEEPVPDLPPTEEENEPEQPLPEDERGDAYEPPENDEQQNLFTGSEETTSLDDPE